MSYCASVGRWSWTGRTVFKSLPTLLLLFLQKCLRFNPDATVWKAKQQVLCSLTESLRDVLNYGLFQPATDGHDAKFLEEERLLKEYPQSFEKGVPYLEVNEQKSSLLISWNILMHSIAAFGAVHPIANRFCYCEIWIQLNHLIKTVDCERNITHFSELLLLL